MAPRSRPPLVVHRATARSLNRFLPRVMARHRAMARRPHRTRRRHLRRTHRRPMSLLHQRQPHPRGTKRRRLHRSNPRGLRRVLARPRLSQSPRNRARAHHRARTRTTHPRSPPHPRLRLATNTRRRSDAVRPRSGTAPRPRRRARRHRHPWLLQLAPDEIPSWSKLAQFACWQASSSATTKASSACFGRCIKARMCSDAKERAPGWTSKSTVRPRPRVTGSCMPRPVPDDSRSKMSAAPTARS